MSSTAFDFQRDVIEASRNTAIVVDFWAEWCAPCRLLGPVLEKLASEANSTWKLVKVNTEEHPQVAAQWGIQGIPAVKMFYGGNVVAEFVGALPESQVRRWLDANVPTESRKLLQAAESALSSGNVENARRLLHRAVAADENNYDARILLAQILFEQEPEEAFALVKNAPEGHPQFDMAQAIQTLHRLISSYEALTETAKQDPSARDAWNLYLQGIQALQQRDYEEALKNWIEALPMNRQLDEDGVRKACVALFNWLGHDHEITNKYHRAFTSALF
ncbi:MAG: tetratricopeptide repeat protein [bacterium]